MVKPYKKTIIIVTLMALFIDVCELVKPFLLEQVMDKYLPDKLYVYNGISIAAIVAFYIIIVIIGNIVDYINRITTNNMGEKVGQNLNLRKAEILFDPWNLVPKADSQIFVSNRKKMGL